MPIVSGCRLKRRSPKDTREMNRASGPNPINQMLRVRLLATDGIWQASFRLVVLAHLAESTCQLHRLDAYGSLSTVGTIREVFNVQWSHRLSGDKAALTHKSIPSMLIVHTVSNDFGGHSQRTRPWPAAESDEARQSD